MKVPLEGVLLRVFVGERERWRGRPLYEAIVERALALDVAGATVLRGVEGYGAHHRVKTARVLRLSDDLPMVVEVVDVQAKIDQLLVHIDEMVPEGLVTLERVRIIKYRTTADPA